MNQYQIIRGVLRKSFTVAQAMFIVFLFVIFFMFSQRFRKMWWELP
jgi:cbb3-type cytochrome oxidase subunit 3